MLFKNPQCHSKTHSAMQIQCHSVMAPRGHVADEPSSSVSVTWVTMGNSTGFRHKSKWSCSRLSFHNSEVERIEREERTQNCIETKLRA